MVTTAIAIPPRSVLTIGKEPLAKLAVDLPYALEVDRLIRPTRREESEVYAQVHTALVPPLARLNIDAVNKRVPQTTPMSFAT
jgi:hypothetical protein